MLLLQNISSFRTFNFLINLILEQQLPDANCIMQIGMHIAHTLNTSTIIVSDYWDAFSDIPCDIFLVDGREAFEHVEKNVIMNNKLARYNNRKYIIVTEELFVSNLFKYVEKLVFLKRIASDNIASNTTLTFNNKTNDKLAEINEYYEIYGKNFNTNELYLIDVWNSRAKLFVKGNLNKYSSNEQFLLFPERLENLTDVTINIGTVSYIPYSDIGE